MDVALCQDQEAIGSATLVWGFVGTVWHTDLKSTEADRRLLIDLEALVQAPVAKRNSKIPIRSVPLERD